MTLLELPRRARGFSLIEVLVAVLVLALGLLGLGAVFPMIVRQQRKATETTLGLSAMNAIEQILHNNANFQPGGRGWAALRDYVIDEDGLITGNWVAVEPDKITGNYILPDVRGGGPDVILPLSQRLFPLPFSTQGEPRFVWDLAARLVEQGNPDSPIMVALFLRPIDPGIRPGLYTDPTTKDALPYSLVNSFVGNIPPKDRRNPLSVDRDGRPMLDGQRGNRAEYSRLAVVEMGPPFGSGVFQDMDWLRVLSAVAANQIQDARLAEQVLAQQGQRFVDRTGHLYKVLGWESVPKRGVNLHISPGLGGLTDANNDGRVDALDLNPVVFAPQGTPIDPKVFIISP